MELRPEVQAFAELMEAQLRANDHKPGWKGDRVMALYRRLAEEGGELQDALMRDAPPETVGREAADVANFAMMIADVAGGLIPTPPRDEAAEQLTLLPPTPRAAQLALPAEAGDE